MSVAKHGLFAGRVQPVGVNQRMTAGGDRLDILKPGLPEGIGGELGGFLDIPLVLGQRANARNAQECQKFV